MMFLLLRKNLDVEPNKVVLSVCTPWIGRSMHAHHAILANKPLGHVRTQNFLNSSSMSRPRPKAAGRNQCSTDIVLVSMVSCSEGM